MDIEIWNKIVSEFKTNPRDVSTFPMKNTTPKWFYVYVMSGNVYVESGRFHKNVSSIKGTRKLNNEELDEMLILHRRRKRGESVSQEATQRTVNQVYWYGIFKEIGL
ncbi:MAG: hypothetical protein J6D23_02515 [Clostridia bacterium]|nr:hypothetical protein [Clostridia bacterium]